MNNYKLKQNTIFFIALKILALLLAISAGPIFHFCKSLVSSYYSTSYYEMFSVFCMVLSALLAVTNGIRINVTIEKYTILVSLILCAAAYIILSQKLYIIEIMNVRFPLTSSKFAFALVFGFDVVGFLKASRFTKNKK